MVEKQLKDTCKEEIDRGLVLLPTYLGDLPIEHVNRNTWVVYTGKSIYARSWCCTPQTIILVPPF